MNKKITKIIRLFYKKCEMCGIGRMVKGICDVCGEAYYEATPPTLPLRTKIWLFFIPNFIQYLYSIGTHKLNGELKEIISKN